jgi:predicted RNA-binding protein
MDQADLDALARNKEMRYNRFFTDAKENMPGLTRELCFFTPREILTGIESNKIVTDWHKWVLNDYDPPKKEIALLFPDSERKPWIEGETSDRSYKNLYIARKSLDLYSRIHILSVSTVFGIIPEERFADMPIYDSAGMFSWSVKKRSLEWDPMSFKDALMKLGEIVSAYLAKNKDKYDKVVAIYRTPSVHERIVENAYDVEPFKLEKLKTKKPIARSYSALKDMLKTV